jgi:thioredoxin reductase
MAHDYLVVGAGPAGLQVASLLADAGHDYVVLERGTGAGEFFRRFPRHRTLISSNKVHTGYSDPELRMRMDWNSLLSDDPELLFTRYSPRYFPPADEMVRYLEDFAARRGIRIEYGTEITHVTRDGDEFAATDQTGTVWRAKRIVMATGVSRPYLPDIPGIDTAEQYATFDTDPASFTDQRVLIIGKGNSAFETADSLIENAAVIHVAGPHSVRMAWQTHFVGHLRAVNNTFLDTYQLKSQNSVLDGTVESIERHDDGRYRVMFRYARSVEAARELWYDRVIACTGFRFDASVFDDTCRPDLVINDRFPAQTSAYESVNVPGLYFAGTITQVRDFKKSTSGFIHGFRYGARALFRILRHRHHGDTWPATEIEPTPEAITDAIIARINRSSGLWQQFGMLGDTITVTDDLARYQEEVPLAFVDDGGLGPARHRFVVDLEFGAHHVVADPFDITQQRVAENDVVHAHDANYLHPVVRYHRDGTPTATHHLAENLENDWDIPAVHQQPLALFVKECLAAND